MGVDGENGKQERESEPDPEPDPEPDSEPEIDSDDMRMNAVAAEPKVSMNRRPNKRGARPRGE